MGAADLVTSGVGMAARPVGPVVRVVAGGAPGVKPHFLAAGAVGQAILGIQVGAASAAGVGAGAGRDYGVMWQDPAVGVHYVLHVKMYWVKIVVVVAESTQTPHLPSTYLAVGLLAQRKVAARIHSVAAGAHDTGSGGSRPPARVERECQATPTTHWWGQSLG